MATKKDFSQIRTKSVYGSIEQATQRKGQQGTVGPEEKKARLDTMQTQGRKGVKLTRINMAFTPSNHTFIKTMARASGQTMTELTNAIITAYRKEHPELMAQAQGFLDTLNNGAFSQLISDEDTEG